MFRRIWAGKLLPLLSKNQYFRIPEEDQSPLSQIFMIQNNDKLIKLLYNTFCLSLNLWAENGIVKNMRLSLSFPY